MFTAPSQAAEHKIGAYNVKVTKDYVKATGVCSCSLMDDRLHHTKVFKNYCPNCHSKGTLTFEQGSISWTSPEGLWYCTKCDIDYCLVHGKSHDYRGKYLTPTTIPKTEPVVQKVPDNAQKVNAQFKEEEYIEIIVGNQKYKISKQKLEELKKAIS
jgi:hypothetical protein